MSVSSSDLRTALTDNLATARRECRSMEYADIAHLRGGGQLPVGERVNPFIIEFLTLVDTIVREHPRWCADCAHAGAACGGGCNGTLWSTDWDPIRVAVWDAEAKALGIATRQFGLVVVPTVSFFGPRTPAKELDVLREHISWAWQDHVQGRDPDGLEYEAASVAAAAFEKEYAKRV